MGAVQDADLALLIGGDVGHHHDVDAGLLERELVLQPGRALDDPDAEHFAHVQHLVVVAVGLLDGGHLLGVADAAGDDAVHQGGAEGVGVVHPVDESLLQAPVGGVVVAALLQLFAVVVDQLAGEDDKALAGVAAERLVPLVEHAGQLGGEAVGGHLVKGAVALGVGDAGLGGVGGDDLQVGAGGQGQHLGPLALAVGAHAVGHAGDHPLVVHLLALFAAAQVEGVQALLGVDPVGHLGEVADGLHQADLAVPAGLLVGNVKEVVHEGPQEVALAELHHLDGGVLQDVPVITGLREYLIIQSFHLMNLLYTFSSQHRQRLWPAGFLPLF